MMKILLIIVALIAIEVNAHKRWEDLINVPGFGNGRGNGQGLPGIYPQLNYPQNNEYGSRSEWVCRNSKTGDTTIFIFDHIPQTPSRDSWQNIPFEHHNYNQGNHWQWQNIPSEHHNHNQGNYWTRPIFVQRPNGNNNNRDDQPQTSATTTTTPTPTNPGGEGIIDIRTGI